MKDGGEVRVFHNRRTDEMRESFGDDAAAIRARRQDMAGYAIVAWDYDGSTSCSVWNYSGRTVPRHLIPEFVSRTVADRIASSDYAPATPDAAS